jgi:hypothetical protein
LHILKESEMLLNEGMATSKETRLDNLRALVKQFGTIEAVAQRAETAPVYLSQILNSVKSSTGTKRGVGDALARRLERGCGKEIGWMDRMHGDAPAVAERHSVNLLGEGAPVICETAGERRLIMAYRLAGLAGQGAFDDLADVAFERLMGRADDKSKAS